MKVLKVIDSLIHFLKKSPYFFSKKDSRVRTAAKHERLLKSLAKVGVVIVDDQGLISLTEDSSRDLIETLAERGRKGKTIITGQLPLDDSHITST